MCCAVVSCADSLTSIGGCRVRAEANSAGLVSSRLASSGPLRADLSCGRGAWVHWEAQPLTIASQPGMEAVSGSVEGLE